MYESGKGVPQDNALAEKWYLSAAMKGNTLAQCNLGNLYENGNGVAKNASQAVVWYRKAAERGDAKGAYFLGDMCFFGWGMEKNEAEGVGWYLKSAYLGNTNAQYQLGQCFSKGTWLPKNESAAMYAYSCASNSGDARDLNAYAWLLLTAKDEKAQDPKKALELATKAVAQSERKNAQYLDTLARAYFKTGAVAEAVETEMTAQAQLPADASEARRKRYEEHLKEFKAGLAAKP